MDAVADRASPPAPAGPRGVLTDVGLGLAVFAAAAAAITADVDPGAREPNGGAYLFALAFGALLLGRRRWPVPTVLATLALLVLYYALDHPPMGVAIPMAAALYSVAESGRLRWATGVAAALLLSSSAARILEGDDLGELSYELVASVIPLAAVIALGDAVRSRRGWRAEVRRRAELAQVEREQEAARRVEQERVRIARELHDVLAHTVSVIAIQADVAAEALADDPAAAQAALGSIRTASRDALGELRTTLGLLREPDGDEPLDPVAGLAQLDAVVGAAADSGLAVAVRTTGRPVPLPAVVDTAAQRIIQESLTNVLRHAGASAAEVELCYGPTALTVRVTDDGRGSGTGGTGGDGPGRPAGGTDREWGGGGGYGIQGMRERAALLGGRLRAGPRPEGGFGVEASLPLVSPS